jgi:hypothetical protein
MVDKKRPLTNAEKQARWRIAHGYVKKREITSTGASPPNLLPTLIPNGGIAIESAEASAAASLVLYDRLVGIIDRWLRELDSKQDIPFLDGLKAFALLPAALESLVTLRGKIVEQRVAEAHDVTKTMAQNLEPLTPLPRIEETLERLRSRFEGKTKAN